MRCVVLLLACLTSACADTALESGATAAAGALARIALPAPVATPPAAPAAVVEVSVPPAAAQARIELAGIALPADQLTAELEAKATGEVRRWTVDAAPGGVSVTVPSYAVPPGEHLLTLWQGDADVVARYRFRVTAR